MGRLRRACGRPRLHSTWPGDAVAVGRHPPLRRGSGARGRHPRRRGHHPTTRKRARRMNVLPYNPQPQGVPLPPNRQWLAIMHDAVALAEAVANTDFVSRSMRGNPPMVLAAILYGDEVGL